MPRFTAVAGALLVLAACTDKAPTIAGPSGNGRGTPPNGMANVVSETSNDLWARIVSGETGPGSLYQL